MTSVPTSVSRIITKKVFITVRARPVIAEAELPAIIRPATSPLSVTHFVPAM